MAAATPNDNNNNADGSDDGDSSKSSCGGGGDVSMLCFRQKSGPFHIICHVILLCNSCDFAGNQRTVPAICVSVSQHVDRCQQFTPLSSTLADRLLLLLL